MCDLENTKGIIKGKGIEFSTDQLISLHTRYVYYGCHLNELITTAVAGVMFKEEKQNSQLS